MKYLAQGSLLAVLVFAVVLISGCATVPPVDWNSRVSNYTFAQAVHELGPPNRQSRLSNGGTVLKWFLQPAGGIGAPNNGMNNGFNAGQNLSPGFNDRYLQLTFDRNGVLTAWSKNY